MRLLHDLILVKPIKEVPQVSGIIIPQKAQKHLKGEIVLIGKNVKALKIGQKVLYNEGDIGIEYGDEKMMLINESIHVVGVID